jgi:uncharacterized protein YegP (UPF0339 family)
MGKFVVVRSANGEHYFNLKADNSQIILTGQMYSSKAACYNDIESVRNNCFDDNRYERKQSAGNKHYFVLKTSKGQIIGNSEMYPSKEGMESGIEFVKKNGSNTSVVEEEPYF